MTALKTALLWAAALAVAALVLWRLRRGRVTYLSGRVSPALVRMVAVLLVYFGAGAQYAAAEGPPKAACTVPEVKLDAPAKAPVDTTHFKQLPKALDGDDAVRRITRWLARPGRLHEDGGAAVLRGESDEVARKALVEAASVLEISSVLERLRDEGRLHLDLVALAFQQAGLRTGGQLLEAADAEPLARLYARAEELATLANAWTLAARDAGPVTFQPWLKKSAAPSGYEAMRVPAGYAKAFAQAFGKADAGPWSHEALLRFTVAEAPKGARLLRRGDAVPLAVGDLVELRRLDLILSEPGKGTLRLQHALLGEVAVPAGRVLSAWHIHPYLSETAKADLLRWTKAAATCDQKALEALARVLPAAAHTVQSFEAWQTLPAPLRTLLTLFYE